MCSGLWNVVATRDPSALGATSGPNRWPIRKSPPAISSKEPSSWRRPANEPAPRRPAHQSASSPAKSIQVRSSSGATGAPATEALTWAVPHTTQRSEAKPSIQAIRPPGEIRGHCSCHCGVWTRSAVRESRSSSPIQASYQAPSDGSSVQTAATLPPAQPSSKTLTPSGPASRVSPVSASTSQSLRQCCAGRRTFGSSSAAPASSIFVAVAAPARSEPRSAASTSSARPSGDQQISSTEPAIAPSSLSSSHRLMRPVCPRSDANASRSPFGEKRGSASLAPGSPRGAGAPSTSPTQSRVFSGSPRSRNEGATVKATRAPSRESSTSPGRSSSRRSSGVTSALTSRILRWSSGQRGAGSAPYDWPMCRNIHTLFNFEPAATDDEIRAAALQYVRKISGFTKPSAVNAVRSSGRSMRLRPHRGGSSTRSSRTRRRRIARSRPRGPGPGLRRGTPRWRSDRVGRRSSARPRGL